MTQEEIELKRKHNKEIRNENDYDEYRPTSLYIILICGLIITLIGVYLTFIDGLASGVSLANRFGQGSGKSIFVTGPGSIAIGLGICIFPVYQLIKKRLKKNH